MYRYLAKKLEASIVTSEIELITTDENVLCINTHERPLLQPCNHEETDSRIILHLVDAYKEGKRSILIQANDTDVLVLAVAHVSRFPGCKIWLAFGTGSSLRYIAVHAIAAVLGEEKSRGLLFLHALTGCDTVSAFYGIGQKNCMEYLEVHGEPKFFVLPALLPCV